MIPVIEKLIPAEQRIASLLEQKTKLWEALEESEGELAVLKDVVNVFAQALLAVKDGAASDPCLVADIALDEAAKLYKKETAGG
jgi:hypothetical protein